MTSHRLECLPSIASKSLPFKHLQLPNFSIDCGRVCSISGRLPFSVADPLKHIHKTVPHYGLCQNCTNSSALLNKMTHRAKIEEKIFLSLYFLVRNSTKVNLKTVRYCKTPPSNSFWCFPRIHMIYKCDHLNLKSTII